MSDARETAALVSLVDQTEHYALQGLQSVNGAREDVALFALVIAAYVVAQETARLHGEIDPRATAEELVRNALKMGPEYARILLEEGKVTFSPSPRAYTRSDAELRALKFELGGES